MPGRFQPSAANSRADAGAAEVEIIPPTPGHASEEFLRRVYLIKKATQAEAGARNRSIA